MGIEEVVLIMKKVGRLLYRLAMALCVLILIMTQDINLGSDLCVTYLVAFLFGCCMVGAFFEMEDK